MPIARYILCVGTSLLMLLYVTNWFFTEPVQKAAQELINEPVVRIASAQRPPESVFIDTSQPTIIPPSIPAEIVPVSTPLQSYASMERAPVTVGIDQKNPEKQTKTRVAAHKPPPVRSHGVATNSPSPPVPATRLSFLDVVSEIGKKVFNLR